MIQRAMHFMSGKLKAIFLLEAVFLVCVTVGFALHFQKGKITLSFLQEDFQCLAGGWEGGSYLDTSKAAFRDIRIGLGGMELPSGSYLVDVEYQAKGIASLAVEYKYDRYEYALTDDVALRAGDSRKSFEITVDGKNGAVAILGRLNSECTQGDYLLFLGVEISSTFTSYRLRIFQLLIGLLLLDGVIYLYGRNVWGLCQTERKREWAGLLAIAFVAGLPLMTKYLFMQQDLAFHLLRIEGLKEGLAGGCLPVRIQPQWLNGHGYPVSVFYGDLWLYIPALLRLFGVPLQDCYKIFAALVHGATAVISYGCFRKMSASRKIGMAAAAIYTLSVYRLINVYVRAAVGEYVAMAFFPLILLGLWYILTQPIPKIKGSKIWIALSFGYLGLLFSHLISCEMAGVMTLLVCLLHIKRVVEKERFMLLAKALAGLVAGGMWFWLPMLDYMRFDFVAGVKEFARYRQEERGLFWAQFFTNRFDVNGESIASMFGMKEEMPLTMGPAFLLILVAAVSLSVCDWKAIKRKKEWATGLCLAFFSMWLCTTDFPFRWLGETFPFTRLLIVSLQFPWRFLAVATLFYVWLFVMILSETAVKERTRSVFAIVVCAVLFLNSMDLMGEVMSRMRIGRVYDGGTLTSFGVSGGEYLYQGADVEDYRDEITQIGEGLTVSGWEKGTNRMEVTAVNASGEERTLELPLILYKGYRAKDSGSGKELYLSEGKSHRAVLHLPGGYAGTAVVRFSEPWYWRVAELVSLAALLGMAGSLWGNGFARKFGKKKNSGGKTEDMA